MKSNSPKKKVDISSVFPYPSTYESLCFLGQVLGALREAQVALMMVNRGLEVSELLVAIREGGVRPCLGVFIKRMT